MKLKDIFSQNTNKAGWLKTFKKLGADNEVLKKLSKEIDSGGGNNSGGGAAETPRSYYKMKFDVLEEFDISFKEMMREVYPLLAALDNINIVVNGRNETVELDISYLWAAEDQTLRNFIGYISSNNTKNWSIGGHSDNGISISYCGKTNSIGLKERYIDFEVLSSTSSRDEAEENYNEYLGLVFEEITKEEYESQLTIK